MSLPVLILGAGGHAKVLIDTLQVSSAVIAGIVDSDPKLFNTNILGVPILGNDDVVGEFPPAEILLVNGLGSISLPVRRQQLFERFKILGYGFAKVVHPSAIVAADVNLNEGVQIMAGAVIQSGSHIGCNVIINTRASVDHDCHIGEHTHIAPGVTLSGGVSVATSSHIGTGATVIQGVRIGSSCVVGAGAVVVGNVVDSETVVGIPARVVKK